MMQRQKIVGMAIAIPTIGFLLWATVQAIYVFLSADQNTKSALIAAFVALATLVFTYWKERSKARQEAHRDKKIEAYSEFFDLISSINKRSNDGTIDEYLASSEFLEIVYRLKRNVLFYGSPKVVVAVGNWSRADSSDANGAIDPFRVLRPVGRVILAMRDDIGLSNFGLDEISIHQINVSDDLSLIAHKK